MTEPGRARPSQRCRTLALAIGLGVLLVTVSIVERGWIAVAVGVVGTAVVIVLYRRECWAVREDGTGSRDS
jgi:Flp pilus assembly protein TadB